MARYAENTQVSSESSRAEIERTLRRYGASEFAYGWDKQQAALMFALADRRIRFALPMPDPPSGASRTPRTAASPAPPTPARRRTSRRSGSAGALSPS
jgi:hypothetical protein